LEGLRESAKNVFDLELVERVIGFGFKRSDAQDLYAVTDEGVLRAAVEHSEQRMRSTTLPPLKSPAAYLRDALKKQYAGAGEGAAPSGRGDSAPREPSVREKLQKLREEWQHFRSTEAKSLFGEMPDGERAVHLARFESERVADLASPIAKAWRRDGINSRVAASSFYRWLASQMWPGEVTDKELLEFAMTRIT
jgi:hypothetical protein